MPIGKRLNRTLKAFIERQKLFFVATAARDGRVNVSPKGMDTLRILDDNRIVWLNLSGSGNETAAHILDSARMTLMFCGFDGDPMILRVYGNAKVTHPRHEGWPELASLFPAIAGSRQIFDLQLDLIQTSCGTGVPLMEFVQDRADSELVPYYENLGEEGVRDYWQRKNVESIDRKPTGIFRDDV